MSDEVGAILAGVRVLYVEDDEDTRSMMVLLFEMAGARVAAVASADDAVATLEREQADVLVSDARLPGQDGWGLIEQVRKRSRARGGKIPAIAVTGSASAADVAHSLEAGFDAHISKPIEVDELLRTMARLVGRGGTANGATA